MTRFLERPHRALKAMGRRRGDLWAYAERLAFSPRKEIKRIWHYSRSDDRNAFLSFQGKLVAEQRSRLSAIRPRHASTNAVPSPGRFASIPGQVSLAELLASYGSDKSTTHDYDVVYEGIAREVGIPRLVFEVGIGTTGERASSMGAHGSPGASARAFRDWGAQVIACDIDRSILFEAPGIRTFYVDQLRPRTFNGPIRHAAHMGGIDLAVIDGLHTPEADVNSLIALLPHLTPNGVLVVEDIEMDDPIERVWEEILQAMPQDYAWVLLQTKASRIVVVGHAPHWSAAGLASLYDPSISDRGQ